MTFEQIITPDDGEGVAPHPHDATEISGEATLITLRVNRLLAGTIEGKEIIVAGGTDGILRSDNFNAGSAGWQVLGDGAAEFNDVTVRGTIIAGAGSDVGFDDVSAGENTAALVIGSGGDMQSSNFATGSTGWQIAGDGSAEFQNVTVRGSINADDIDAGSLDVDRVTAKSLSFEKLMLGSPDNLVQNPGAEDAVLAPHFTADAGGSWSAGTEFERSGSRHFRYDTNGQSGDAAIEFNGFREDREKHVACGEGETFYLSVWARGGGTGPYHRIRLLMLWRNAVGDQISSTSTIESPTVSYQQFDLEGTAPAGTAYVVFRVGVIDDSSGTGHRIGIDDVYARRQIGSVVLEADLQSDNFSAGSAGWQIKRDTGDAEFNTGTFRGTLTAAQYRTASSGTRIDINPSSSLVDIEWYEGTTLAATVGYLTGSNSFIIFGENNRDVQLSAGTATVLLDTSASGTRISSDGVALKVDRATGTSTDNAFQVISNVGGTDTLNLNVDADGDVQNTNNSYGSLSDKRVKKNIKTARSYLDDLRKVRITTHTLKSTGARLLGPIAQEVQPVFPGLVREREDGYLTVKHSVFVPMLITAVQELADRVEALEK